ncbi:MAG: ATP-binding protein [Cyanobacteriota bacterium]
MDFDSINEQTVLTKAKYETVQLINESLNLNNVYLKAVGEKIRKNNERLKMIGENINQSNSELFDIRENLLNYNLSLKNTSIALSDYNDNIRVIGKHLLAKNESLESISKSLLEQNTSLEEIGNGLLTNNKTLEETGENLRKLNIEMFQSENNFEEKGSFLEKKFEEKTKELNILIEKLDKANVLILEANQHRNYFLNRMSHELLTPLNAIVGFSTMLKKECYGPLNEKQRSYASLIVNNSEHLTNIINALFDITLIDTDKMKFELELCFINSLIEEIISFMKIQFLNKKITIEFEANSEVDVIKADNKRIKQIIVNLLCNAIKYTPDSGKIKIMTEKYSDDSIKITISDNGCGINVRDLEKVFDDFYQCNPAEGELKEGVGIGLALCKRLVNMHGGTIGVDSELNTGSSFWFILPINM